MLLKIKKKEIANYLIDEQQFKFVAEDLDNVWYIEPPADMSNAKARRLVSAVIKLNLAMMDLVKAKNRYNTVVEDLNKIVIEV